MRRGTTPTVTVTVTNDDKTAVDLRGRSLFLTFKEQGCGGAEITKTEEDMAIEVEGKATILSVPLTQEETLSFHSGYKVRVQLRCTDGDDAAATDIAEFTADEILKEGVI